MSSVPVIVAGGSAGGLAASERLVASLSPDLHAAIAVVLHQSDEADDYVTRRLQHCSPIPALVAEDGMPIEARHLYIAPPGQHLRFENGQIRVAFGPRVNRARPAIDVAFRSVAAGYGARAVGVVLSGFLDDGAAGAVALQCAGARVLVQDPADAEHPDMPRNALAVVEADVVAPADALGRALAAVVTALPSDPGQAPESVLTEARLDALATGDIDLTEEIGAQVPISCPDCGGPIWEIDAPGPPRYRCHVGHAYSRESMLAQQEETVEESLWVALRTLEERARMLDRMAGTSGQALATSYGDRADETRQHADRIRALLGERHRSGEQPLVGMLSAEAAPTEVGGAAVAA